MTGQEKIQDIRNTMVGQLIAACNAEHFDASAALIIADLVKSDMLQLVYEDTIRAKRIAEAEREAESDGD